MMGNTTTTVPEWARVGLETHKAQGILTEAQQLFAAAPIRAQQEELEAEEAMRWASTAIRWSKSENLRANAPEQAERALWRMMRTVQAISKDGSQQGGVSYDLWLDALYKTRLAAVATAVNRATEHLEKARGLAREREAK